MSDSVEAIQQALDELERLGRTNEFSGKARTALRVRTMALVDRLDFELGKRRLLEGNFSAARYHLSAAHQRAQNGAHGAQTGAASAAPRVSQAAAVALEGHIRRHTMTPRVGTAVQ
jgi:hypothetical protein